MDSKETYYTISFYKDADSGMTLFQIYDFYNTEEAANEDAARIVENNPDGSHDVLVGIKRKWHPFNPTKEHAENVEYSENMLNDIMKGYKENQQKAKVFFEYEKTEKMIKNVEENREVRLKNRKELLAKLSKAKTSEEMTTITNSLEMLDGQLKDMEKRLEEIVQTRDTLKEKLGGENQ